MSTPVNGLNITSSGIVRFDGTATFSATTTTQYNVLIGNTANAITNVAPSATSGIPLVSNGNAANPSFTTAVVAGGGTGNTTFTAYSVICAGTTATGAFQNVSGVGTSGQVLTSNGAGALPTWQAAGSGGFTQIVIQTFTGNGTYTPTSGMKCCIVEAIGGGGGGGGAANTSASTVNGGGGGGGGSYSMSSLTAAQIGVSQTVTIGAAGTAGSAGNNNGGNGGNTSLGILVVANGGSLGGGAASNNTGLGGAGGTGGTGTLKIDGGEGIDGNRNANTPVIYGISGGSSPRGYGSGGLYLPGLAGEVGKGYGAGGGGGSSFNAGGSRAGAAGTAGIIVITEYI